MVSTAFRLPNPLVDGPVVIDMWNPSRHVYSRYTQGVSTRTERVLSKITVIACPPRRTNDTG